MADPVTIAAVTRKNANHSEEAIRKLGDCCPEVNGKVVNLKFPGRRQRDTPATDAKAGGPFRTAWRGMHQNVAEPGNPYRAPSKSSCSSLSSRPPV